MSRAARLCWFLDRNRWMLTTATIAGALAFVIGCIFFYFDSLYVAGVTLFLFGSICMLLEALANAVWRHGPSS